MLSFLRVLAVIVIAVVAFRMCNTADTSQPEPVTTRTTWAPATTTTTGVPYKPIRSPYPGERIGVVFDVHVANTTRHDKPVRVVEWSRPVNPGTTDYPTMVRSMGCDGWLYEYQEQDTDGGWGPTVRTDWSGSIMWTGDPVRIRILWECTHDYVVGRWLVFRGQPTCPGCR